MNHRQWNALSEDVAQSLQEYVEHPDRVTPAMRETIRHARCIYRGSSMSVEALADQVRGQVSGHSTIPEDQEYQYAVKLVTVGKELSPSSRLMLEIYTGYDESKLVALRNESADAFCEASVALYGRPFDLV